MKAQFRRNNSNSNNNDNDNININRNNKDNSNSNTKQCNNNKQAYIVDKNSNRKIMSIHNTPISTSVKLPQQQPQLL